MTPKEYIKQEYGEAWLKHKWSAGDVIDVLEDHGRYCAEQAFIAGFNECKEYYPGTFTDWWSEFQRKEETK